MAKINQTNDVHAGEVVKGNTCVADGSKNFNSHYENKVIVSQVTRNRSKSRSRYTTFSHAQSKSHPTSKETTDQSCSLLL